MVTCSKCGHSCPQDQVRYTGLGINTRPRAYCPACWRKVEWARAHPRDRQRSSRTGATARRDTAQERAQQRYWERVDNYRELGYDPNQQ